MALVDLSPAAFAAKAAEAAALLKALAHETRLLVLCQLLDGEHSAGALQEGSELSQVSTVAASGAPTGRGPRRHPARIPDDLLPPRRS